MCECYTYMFTSASASYKLCLLQQSSANGDNFKRPKLAEAAGKPYG